jgi:hypothetical protein
MRVVMALPAYRPKVGRVVGAARTQGDDVVNGRGHRAARTTVVVAGQDSRT